MRWTPLVAVLSLAFSLALGACDDLGQCKDQDLKGRIPVESGGRVMYLGQAILNVSCATGCHASNAKGAQRVGAPAGLDFDIVPIDATGTQVVQTPDGGTKTVATVDDPSLLSRLRERQRKVFDTRHEIWQQVSDGLMPPSGVGQGFKSASPGVAVRTSGGTCTRGEVYPGLSSKATREALREWLACGAPIVEMSSPQLTAPVGGTIGDQFPVCDGGGGGEATFEAVYAIFQGSCVAGCHQSDNPSFGSLDLSTPEVAYMELLGDGSGGVEPACGTAASPRVTPGNAEQSFLWDKLANARPSCGSAMPVGPPLSPAQLDVIRRWIDGGALPPGASGDANPDN